MGGEDATPTHAAGACPEHSPNAAGRGRAAADWRLLGTWRPAPGTSRQSAVERGPSCGTDARSHAEFAREHVTGAEFVRGDGTASVRGQSFDRSHASSTPPSRRARAGRARRRGARAGGPKRSRGWTAESGTLARIAVEREEVGVSAPAESPQDPVLRFADEDAGPTLTGAGLADRRWTRRVSLHSAARTSLGRMIEGAVRMRAVVQVRATTCSVRSIPVRRVARRPRRRRRRDGSVSVKLGRAGSRDRPGGMVADALAAVRYEIHGSEEAMASCYAGHAGARASREWKRSRTVEQSARDALRAGGGPNMMFKKAHGTSYSDVSRGWQGYPASSRRGSARGAVYGSGFEHEGALAPTWRRSGRSATRR